MNAAAKIVTAAFTNAEDGRSFYTRKQLEGKINAAIRRAVNAERERCVYCVCGLKYNPKLSGHDSMILRVVAAINTPAKKRPSKRKGRR